MRRTASIVYSPKDNAGASKKLYSNISYCTAEPSSKSYRGTQNRVGEYQNSIGSTSKTIDSYFEYTYDDGGNITDEFIKDPDANDGIQNRYEYDPVWKDQLKKEKWCQLPHGITL